MHTPNTFGRLSVNPEPPYDPLGAFVRDNHIALAGADTGPLDDLVFAAKDVWEIEGSTVGNGHPAFLAWHGPDTMTASILTRLLEAGADMVGKTVCDELCFSISGENWHYGSPLNPWNPWRYTGGSSSGSAAATAAELVDFALGSDCLGSVRVPASYNGLLGMRPTYKRVPDDGEVPYCPSMDVVGFMAKEPRTFERVAEVMLGEDESPVDITRALRATDCFDVVDPSVAEALADAVEHVQSSVLETGDVVVDPDGLDSWVETFRHIQGFEVWRSYRDWMAETNPRINAGPAGRLDWASGITDEQYAAGNATRERLIERFNEIVPPGTVLVLPTAASIAPLREAPLEEINATRLQSTYLLCISPLCNAPQITLPLTVQDGMPLGLTLIAAPGSDLALARFAARLVTTMSLDPVPAPAP